MPEREEGEGGVRLEEEDVRGDEEEREEDAEGEEAPVEAGSGEHVSRRRTLWETGRSREHRKRERREGGEEERGYGICETRL